MSTAWEEVETYFGMPEEADRECTEWLDEWRDCKEAEMRCFNLQVHLSTKAIAMQSAGVVEFETPLEDAAAIIQNTKELPGLPIRVLMSW